MRDFAREARRANPNHNPTPNPNPNRDLFLEESLGGGSAGNFAAHRTRVFGGTAGPLGKPR